MNRRKFVGASVATLAVGMSAFTSQSPTFQTRTRRLEGMITEATLNSGLFDPGFVTAAQESLHLEVFPPGIGPDGYFGQHFGDWSIGLYLRPRHETASNLSVVDDYFNFFSHDLSHVFWSMLPEEKQDAFKASVHDLGGIYESLLYRLAEEETYAIFDDSERMSRKAFFGYNRLLEKRFEYTQIYGRHFDNDIMRMIFSGQRGQTKEEVVAEQLDTAFTGPEEFAFLFDGGLNAEYRVSSGLPALFDIDNIPEELHKFYEGFLHPDHF